ncbi:MAG: hypothetical protein HQL56_04135, partial [Magnetococcales bacterium]|nr:hypothetical protein [Magnetococcales bacterium]
MNGVKITLSNLGPLRYAEFEPGPFTIICGENNTGKTYATYALFGFLNFWHEGGVAFPVPDQEVDTLLKQGTLKLPIASLLKQVNPFLEDISDQFSKKLRVVFAADASFFPLAKIRVTIEKDVLKPLTYFEQ